jgi:hypothetical protein
MYIYINVFEQHEEQQSNAVDKSFWVVITGMMTYTIYMKFEEMHVIPSRGPSRSFQNLPTSQIFFDLPNLPHFPAYVN